MKHNEFAITDEELDALDEEFEPEGSVAVCEREPWHLAQLRGDVWDLDRLLKKYRNGNARLPTEHLPGSIGKLAILQRRYKMGLELFIEGDAGDEGDSIQNCYGLLASAAQG